ncbi:peptide chain release factor 2 [Phycisphaerales bacterium AB-hyl4]|uniref:Peptide chain release factor 2 n=1 Tax=Natronomicrosphaera hydrolytica TaxID=3242702 RepID=A0ABV4U217_9BACT
MTDSPNNSPLAAEGVADLLEDLKARVLSIRDSLDYDNKANRRAELEKQMEQPEFWNEPDAANKVVTELKSVKAQIEPLRKAQQKIDDALLMWEMAEEADDADTRNEVAQQLPELQKELDRLETVSLLSGKYDARNCYLSIYAREGGTEAQDWTEMLMRMYLYYCERMGWDVTEVDKSHGEEAGLKDVTLHVKGPLAYGYLSTERGTHRLARVSPFNAQGKRQTSFASVDVTPEFEDTGAITLDENDLEITAFARSSGPGGQNVNKVASAVRIVHKPTSLQVVCSVHKSQQQNRNMAMAILLAKIELLEEQKREAAQLEAAGGKLDMGWGTQIRSYVFYDNRVKDHRTSHEQGNPQSVMDGDIHGFIEAELKRRTRERGAKK